jgi:alkanesulfonate monooxygenase SsuD/methylene tetrahydromethanopterin reductase-like flavin-dependent oxidoreductase (luciferase family)
VAALGTPESFVNAGRAGHGVMAIPMAGGRMKELIAAYREAWRSAGHPGRGRVMLAFHMYCAESRSAAEAVARAPLERYLRSLVQAAGDWTAGLSSADYPGYDRMIDGLRRETYDSQVASGAAWVGTPDTIAAQIARYGESVGGFESASLQVNFNTVGLADAERSMRLFGEKVLPLFGGA